MSLVTVFRDEKNRSCQPSSRGQYGFCGTELRSVERLNESAARCHETLIFGWKV